LPEQKHDFIRYSRNNIRVKKLDNLRNPPAGGILLVDWYIAVGYIVTVKS